MTSQIAPTFKPFSLALIQLGQIGPDKSLNLQHAKEMILKAVSGCNGNRPKPDLVVLPECFNSPYGHVHFPKYAEVIAAGSIEDGDSASIKMLREAAKECGVWLIGGSIPERDAMDPTKVYNTSTVYSPHGELVAKHRKVHLFDIDIPGKMTFMESKSLSGGTSLNYFDTDFARIGLGICYDVRFPELAMVMARKGAHVMIYPGAFNLTTGPLHWELLQRARAVDNQIFVAMCSPARDMSAGYHAWGHSMVVDPMGGIVVEGGHDEEIVYAQIDPQVFHDARTGIPVSRQRRFDVYVDVGTSE